MTWNLSWLTVTIVCHVTTVSLRTTISATSELNKFYGMYRLSTLPWQMELLERHPRVKDLFKNDVIVEKIGAPPVGVKIHKEE